MCVVAALHSIYYDSKLIATLYSRVHVSSDTAFFKGSEETIHSAGINATSYEPPWFFHTEKQNKNFFEQPNNQKPKN